MSKPNPKGVLVKHPQGFALVVPWHVAYRRESDRPLLLGRIEVKGDVHKSLSLAGRVPDSWLVDLNSAPVEFEVAA